MSNQPYANNVSIILYIKNCILFHVYRTTAKDKMYNDVKLHI